MSVSTAEQILDREFLEMRAKVLQLAASFDRLARAEGDASADPRLEQLNAALQVLLQDGTNRAERLQLIFSRPYAEDWQTTFQLRS